MGNFARKVLRKQQQEERKKAQNPLAALPKPADLARMKESLDGVEQMRQAIGFLISDINQLIYNTEKQRAVTVRLMHAATKGPSFMVVGGSTPANYTIEQLRELEEQYSAEYDAIAALGLLGQKSEE